MEEYEVLVLCPVRKQRAVAAASQAFLLLFSRGLPCSGWFFPPQLNISKDALTDIPRGLSFRWF